MGEDAGANTGRTRGAPQRLTLREAARTLGISEGAVRKRVSRGSIPSEVGEDGRRYVYFEEDDTGADEGRPGGEDALSEANAELRARVESLERSLESEREARRRADHIIAALTERIPELEAPPQSAQEAESVATRPSESAASEGDDESAVEPTETPTQTGHHRPWWKRWFGVGEA